jgi:hypothetical protein
VLGLGALPKCIELALQKRKKQREREEREREGNEMILG